MSSSFQAFIAKYTMESPRTFNDCYFYYYSTCTKGDSCIFRHEPSALGCETMCRAWQQGKCLDQRCKLRHMELRKNRKQIPCYWENQPGGCRKKHCPFMHKNPEARTDGIAPSQPIPPSAQPTAPGAPAQVAPTAEPVGVEAPLGVAAPPLPAPAPVPAPVPLLWQQQRQVVLDSAILGVLPSSELLAGRRPMPHEATAYAPMPVDPLVVNFEEESDNESAPSSTPTKAVSPEDQGSQSELQLLEKIQAEAAAFYSYAAEDLPPKPPRVKLSTKYERLSLDEISGRKQKAEVKRTSLDFKVMSLDEIRATKRDTIVQSTPITLNLNRKRKLSAHETITSTGKMIKVVRSNSVVYKKVDASNTSAPKDSKNVGDVSRKRTFSELSDIEIHDELDDSVSFKKVKLNEPANKPKLVRFKHAVGAHDQNNDDDVQVIESNTNDAYDSSIDPVNVIDLCDDLNDSDVPSDVLDLCGVPDVVASCRTKDSMLREVTEIDIINDDSL